MGNAPLGPVGNKPLGTVGKTDVSPPTPVPRSLRAPGRRLVSRIGREPSSLFPLFPVPLGPVPSDRMLSGSSGSKPEGLGDAPSVWRTSGKPVPGPVNPESVRFGVSVPSVGKAPATSDVNGMLGPPLERMVLMPTRSPPELELSDAASVPCPALGGGVGRTSLGVKMPLVPMRGDPVP